jgi:hypothetical protein
VTLDGSEVYVTNSNSVSFRVQKENTVMVNPVILRTAFVIALLMALGGVLSACGFSNTFNYGHGQGACENCGDEQ